MKKTLILFAAFFIICCNKKPLNNNPKEIFKKIEDNRFIYVLYYNNIENSKIRYERLNVLDKKSNKNIQTIDLRMVNKTDIPNSLGFFSLEDVNFDGANDIKIIQNIYAYSATSSFWVFDIKINQFVHYKKLDEINNPIIIRDKKEICSYSHGAQNTFNLFKYFWQGDSLITKEKYEEEWFANGKGNLKISKFENGKWKIYEKEIKERFVENLKCQ